MSELDLQFTSARDTKNMVRFELDGTPEGENPLAFYLPKELVEELGFKPDEAMREIDVIVRRRDGS